MDVNGIDRQHGVRSDGTRWEFADADGVVIDGVLHKPGDEVLIDDLRRPGKRFHGRITAIYSTNRGPWRCALDSAFGATTRGIGQLGAVPSDLREDQ